MYGMEEEADRESAGEEAEDEESPGEKLEQPTDEAEAVAFALAKSAKFVGARATNCIGLALDQRIRATVSVAEAPALKPCADLFFTRQGQVLQSTDKQSARVLKLVPEVEKSLAGNQATVARGG